MIKRLTIEIECGEDTCASTPGHFCIYRGARIDGSEPACDLFRKRLYDKNGDIEGWLLRCKECKEAQSD